MVLQAIGMGAMTRTWLAGPGLNAEYELKKREQEELLKEQEVYTMAYYVLYPALLHILRV